MTPINQYLYLCAGDDLSDEIVDDGVRYQAKQTVTGVWGRIKPLLGRLLLTCTAIFNHIHH